MSTAETVATIAMGAFFVGGWLLSLGFLCIGLHTLRQSLRVRRRDTVGLFLSAILVAGGFCSLCIATVALALLIGGEIGVN